MKIALVGYGKMGKAIEQIANNRGHEIILKITSSNKEDLNIDKLQQADVAIEFTSPESAKENVLTCLQASVPVVCGSTGWNEGLQEAHEATTIYKTAFLQASNFSVGVNIFFEVNKQLAKLMDVHPEYNITIEETHHTQKKDSPSGTAITLAEQILANMNRKTCWEKEQTNKPNCFPIKAHRIENVPGKHNIRYTSPIDDIEIIHTAHNRDGFAIGAVLAAEFIVDKKGVFAMKDVLGM